MRWAIATGLLFALAGWLRWLSVMRADPDLGRLSERWLARYWDKEGRR
jgi:hypothetical protein